MKGSEFLKKLRKLGKMRGINVRLVPERGKGSHSTVYYGSKFTTIKDLKKEIGLGLLSVYCKQLGVDKNDLNI